MRPLYLKGGNIRVRQDGPSLRISKAGQAEGWYPLQRVSRVISSTRVNWQTEALLACSQEGITISFLDDGGSVVARLVGRVGEREEIRQRLSDFLLRAEWRERYDAWCLGMEQMAVRSVARRAGFPKTTQPTPRDLRQALRGQADDAGLLTLYDNAGQQIQGLLIGFVTQQLADSGISPERMGLTEPSLTLDFTRILLWDFRLAILDWLEPRRESGLPPEAEVIAFFEARQARTEQLGRGLLNRLHHWLIEQYPWR